MGYAVESVESIKERLAALPAIEPKKREVSKQEAIALLADEIAALQKRGYSLDEIASRLTSEGIEIKTTTLKNYLTRIRRGGKLKKSKESGKRRGASTNGEELKSGKAESAAVQGDRDEAKSVDAAKEPAAVKATFTPREDSDEI